jgi:hypothetical protein
VKENERVLVVFVGKRDIIIESYINIFYEIFAFFFQNSKLYEFFEKKDYGKLR